MKRDDRGAKSEKRRKDAGPPLRSSLFALLTSAVALQAVSAAYGQDPAPRADANRHGIDLAEIQRRLPKGRVVKTEPPLTEEDFAVPARIASQARFERLERLPTGVPIVTIEVLDDATLARGEVASGGTLGDAVVFMQASDSGYFLPISATDAGSFEANLLQMGNAWGPWVPLTGLRLTLFNSNGGPSGPATIEAELWVGDPLGIFDTACGGPAPIAGTQCTFSDLPDAASGPCASSGGFPVQPCVGLHQLRCVFPGKVLVPNGCDHVWLAWRAVEGCRVGWRLSGSALGVTNDQPARAGFSDGVEYSATCALFASGCDRFNSNCANPNNTNRRCGTCCDNGGPTSGIPCDHTDGFNECAHPTFCSDGDADYVTAYTYQQYGAYASYLAALYAVPLVTVSLSPIGNDPAGGLDPGVSISGQTMTMHSGGRRVFFEFRVGDWDPADDGEKLRSYQFSLEGSGIYRNLLLGTVSPSRLPCAGKDAVCSGAFGPGATCDDLPDCASGECYCTPLFIDTWRGDPDPFVIPPSSGPYCLTNLALQWLGCSTIVFDVDEPVPFPPGGLYAGTFVADVTADAVGTFVISLDPLNSSIIWTPHPGSSVDVNVGLPVPLLGLTAALLTILDCNENSVSDGNDIAAGTSRDCNGNLVPDECDIAGGTSQDVEGNGIPDECQETICGNRTCEPGERCFCAADCGVQPARETAFIACGDGLDNDCDGEADCADSDCFLDHTCSGVPAVSQWGIIVLGLLLACVGRIAFRRAGQGQRPLGNA